MEISLFNSKSIPFLHPVTHDFDTKPSVTTKTDGLSKIVIR